MKSDPDDGCSFELSSELSIYNDYILDKLKTIKDFDVWYEAEYKHPFPPEWYAIIKTTSC